MLAQLSPDCKDCILRIRLLGSSATSLTLRDRWQNSSTASARRDCNRPSAPGLIYAGPAHTKGDTLVYLPRDRTVFAGDLLFVGGHPVIWAGPVANWIRACDRILSWDVDVVVPGHGPITDKTGVRHFKGYLEYINGEARRRYDAGLSYYDAATEISLDPYMDWIDSERIVINVASLYREYGMKAQPTPLDLWTDMFRFHKAGLCNCGRAPHAGFKATKA
jgi:cyclase